MYFVAKVKYLEPVGETDEVKRKSSSLLVRAITVTDAETKVIANLPGNWREASVESVQTFSLEEIIKEGPSENWYAVKLMYESFDKPGKWTACHVLVNGNDPIEILRRALSKHPRAEVDSLKRAKLTVDEDLV